MTRRAVVRVAAVLFGILVIHDLSVANHRGLGVRGAIFLIDGYRARVSPHMGLVGCRFKPSCSAYGREVIRERGFVVGVAKTAWRIARCGPWTSPGTVDPP